MAGKNLITESYSDITMRALKSRSDFICVFISHQKADKEISRKIADYLMAIGINVYFDEYDQDLRLANQARNPKAVTQAILKGIQKSTHMLCVVSPNTLDSKWVPFEVGFGYDKTQLGILLLKGVRKEQLPEYIMTAPLIIPDIWDLNKFIEAVSSKGVVLENRILIKNYGDLTHPLANYMESINML
jgi:hypothetical protein